MQVASLDYDDGSGIAAGKLRSRAMVKPILKKLNSHTNSDRGSLDYDRGWEEQVSPLGFPSLDYSSVMTGQPGQYTSSTEGSRSRDVSFSLSASEYAATRGRKYSHMRSPSGNSHVSNATSASGRNGSFVHPFQQTPRTATPPLSYANSIVSLETNSVARDYSAANDDESTVDRRVYSSASMQRPTYATSTVGRSSLSEVQRSSSMTEAPSALKHAGSRSSATGRPFRTVHNTIGTNNSRTDLASSMPSSTDSPLSLTAPMSSASPLMASSTPPSSASPMSPLRASLDLGGFRLRSRSEVDAVTEQEQVREARRKFEAREKAKEEKYAKLQQRKRDRADNRHSRLRKGSLGATSLSSTAESVPALTRKSTSNIERRSTSREKLEKLELNSKGYDAVAAGDSPAGIDDVQFQTPKRRRTAKKATTGVWTAFMLWFRTRLLKLGRR